MARTESEKQSAAERRIAEGRLLELLAVFTSSQQRVVASLRRRLRKRLPTAHELVYDYGTAVVISFSPTEHGYEGVFAIRADGKGVKLYFNRGKELSDPDKLLQGKAGQVRFIEVEDASILARVAVSGLISRAIAGNPVPFARSGKGSVVIRSSQQKKKKQNKQKKQQKKQQKKIAQRPSKSS
jgi:hypothetical protein